MYPTTHQCPAPQCTETFYTGVSAPRVYDPSLPPDPVGSVRPFEPPSSASGPVSFPPTGGLREGLGGRLEIRDEDTDSKSPPQKNLTFYL